MQENVFFFLTMKKDVIFFYDHLSLEEGLRLMRKHGFTAMPVINTHGEYVERSMKVISCGILSIIQIQAMRSYATHRSKI